MTDHVRVVSWAGPVESAVQELRVATEQLERKNYRDGVAALERARDRINEAAAFIARTT